MNPSAASIPTNILLEHSTFVRSLAYSLLRDEHLAEDAAQETWMRWMQHPPEEMGRTRGWLATVVRGVALSGASSRRARRDRELALAVPEASADPVQELEQAEIIKSMVEGVIDLDEPVQSAILLTYFRGWTTRRIAKEQGISASTVSGRVKRGLEELRIKLDHERAGNRDEWFNAMVAVAGKGTMGASVPAGISTLVPVLPWVVAALVLVIAVSNWSAPNESPAIAMDTEALVVEPPPTPPPLADATAAVAFQEQTPSERQAVVSATPQGKLKISGTVTNQAYAKLDMVAGPAANASMRVSVGKAGSFSSPSIRSTETLDEAGSFELLLDDPGMRPLRVSLSIEGTEGYHHCGRSLTLEEGENELLDLKLDRLPTGLLSGIVVDERGASVPEVELILRGRFGRQQMEKTVTTDKVGRFEVEQHFEPRVVDVSAFGYTYLSHDGGELIRDGGHVVQAGWSDLRVTVGPAASLRVRVVGPRETGLRAAKVTVKLHESELSSLGIDKNPFASGASHSAETDSTGYAELSKLWADRRISVRVSVAKESHSASLALGDELVFEEFGAGEAILLNQGEAREFRVQWHAQYQLTGQVLEPDGNPASGAKVKVYDGGDEEPYRDSLGTITADDNGEFQWELLRQNLVGPIVLVASHHVTGTEPAGLGALGYAGDPPTAKPTEEPGTTKPVIPGVGLLELPLDSAVDDEFVVSIQLAPTFALAGRVRDADGESPTDGFGGARIWIVPAGTGSHLTKAPLGSGQKSTQDGQFRFEGLPAGDYDIHVSREMRGFYSFSSFMHTFRGLAAGNENLDLVIPEQGAVQIKVRVHGIETDKMTVLHGRYFPFDPGSYEKSLARESQEIRSLSGWPRGAPLNFTGISGDRTADAMGMMGLYGATGTSDHNLPPMGAGWYAIGVKPRTLEGNPSYSAVATPIQWFEPGQYVIDFYPAETVTMEGRVNGSEPIGIQVVDETGAPFGCQKSRGFAGKGQRFVESNAAGQFMLHDVPVGDWRVRMGTLGELASGAFRKEVLTKFYVGMPDLVLDL
jgi:RNA polymerase sigma factor (sigma-70 family)